MTNEETHCIVCGDELDGCNCEGCRRWGCCTKDSCWQAVKAVSDIQTTNPGSLFPTHVFACPFCLGSVNTVGLRTTAETAAWTHLDACRAW